MKQAIIKLRTVLLLAIYTVIIASCSLGKFKALSTFKQPKFEYQKNRVVAVGEKKVDVDLIFDVSNPNDMALDSIFANYELFIKDKSFIKGKDLQLKLIANGKSTVHVPVEVYYNNLLQGTSSVLKSVLNNDKKIPVTADVKIFGELEFTHYLSTTVSYNKHIDMSVPVPKKLLNDKLKQKLKSKLKDKLKNLF